MPSSRQVFAPTGTQDLSIYCMPWSDPRRALSPPPAPALRHLQSSGGAGRPRAVSPATISANGASVSVQPFEGTGSVGVGPGSKQGAHGAASAQTSAQIASAQSPSTDSAHRPLPKQTAADAQASALGHSVGISCSCLRFWLRGYVDSAGNVMWVDSLARITGLAPMVPAATFANSIDPYGKRLSLFLAEKHG